MSITLVENSSCIATLYVLHSMLCLPNPMIDWMNPIQCNAIVSCIATATHHGMCMLLARQSRCDPCDRSVYVNLRVTHLRVARKVLQWYGDLPNSFPNGLTQFNIGAKRLLRHASWHAHATCNMQHACNVDDGCHVAMSCCNATCRCWWASHDMWCYAANTYR